MVIYLHDSKIEILSTEEASYIRKIKERSSSSSSSSWSSFLPSQPEEKKQRMAASNRSFHTRSTSFPSKSHTNLAGVQGCLHLAKAWEACPSRKARLVTRLGHLKDLYASVNAFLHLPLTQQALCGMERLVRELMDDFLRLVDACGLVKDSLPHMREQHQTLQSMLRRGVTNLESGICAYQGSRKRMKKEMAKCLRLLGNLENHVASSYDNLDMVDQAFNDVRAVTVSTFKALSSMMSGRKATRSIFSRLLSSMSSKSDEDGVSEIEKTDMAIFRLHNGSFKAVRQEDTREAQRLMEELDISLREVEVELEDVFKCMIQAKVSLLNIVTCC